MPEELNACETIIRRQDAALTLLTLITNTIVNAIWDTDENAIIFFKSTTNRQVNPTKVSLSIDTTINTLKSEYADMVGPRRKIPKPPNFSKIPAKTIDP